MSTYGQAQQGPEEGSTWPKRVDPPPTEVLVSIAPHRGQGPTPPAAVRALCPYALSQDTRPFQAGLPCLLALPYLYLDE